MTSKTTQRRALWAAGFYAHLALVTAIVTVAYLGWLPDVGPVGRFDYVGHAVMIGLLAFFLDGALGFRPLLGQRRPRLAWLRLAPVVVIAVAGAEELAQALSPHRTCSLSDFAGDVVGVIALSALARWIDRRWRVAAGGGGASVDRAAEASRPDR
jgi:hypothetical protein